MAFSSRTKFFLPSPYVRLHQCFFSSASVVFFFLTLPLVCRRPSQSQLSFTGNLFFFFFKKKVIFTQQVYNLTSKKKRIESSGLELWCVSVMAEWKKFALKKTENFSWPEGHHLWKFTHLLPKWVVKLSEVQSQADFKHFTCVIRLSWDLTFLPPD